MIHAYTTIDDNHHPRGLAPRAILCVVPLDADLPQVRGEQQVETGTQTPPPMNRATSIGIAMICAGLLITGWLAYLERTDRRHKHHKHSWEVIIHQRPHTPQQELWFYVEKEMHCACGADSVGYGAIR